MKRLVLFAAVVGLAGCVSTQLTMLDLTAPKRPAVHPDSVRIYRTPDRVKGRYEEIALLHATGETDWTSERTMLESMRRKAGRAGANGVILDSIKEPGTAERIAGAILKTGTVRKGRAVAIFVFPDSAARTP